MKKSGITKKAEFKDRQSSKRGPSKSRDLKAGGGELKLGRLIYEARIEKGMTQEELADRCGTNKAYISRVENNIRDVRISTLQKIVKLGFDGHLNLSIKL